MKIVTIIGARPQFIKAAMISRVIRTRNALVTSHQSLVTEVLVHTGQHYDYEMDKVFFDQLDIPKPNYYLGIGSGSHGDQTGRMLIEIEKVLLNEKPDIVLVYGDTNSTLAGALASAKLNISVGHIEAGMRSFNRIMPEEINRVVSGHLAKWHFCPTETSVENLKREGISECVYLVGDVMQDAVKFYKDKARQCSTIVEKLGLPDDGYVLATAHRAENTDNPDRLRNIIEALIEISKEMPVVLPLHPRTRKSIEDNELMSLITSQQSLVTLKPLPYLDLLRLEQSASVIVTDSGGMQKEAFWLSVPCVTMRDETEWVETVEAGYNRIAGADKNKIVLSVHSFIKEFVRENKSVSDEPAAAKKIIDVVVSELS